MDSSRHLSKIKLQKPARLVLGLALFVLSQPRAVAHGDVHLQILALTEDIAKNTNDAALYVKRGELYRLHQSFDAAHVDFQTAAHLTTNQWPVVHLAQARLYLDMGWPLSAREAIDKFLRQKPDHPEGLTLRAHVLVQLEEPLAAAEAFSRAIAHQLSPGPELYIDRARAFALAGDEFLGKAIGSLDEGIRALGSLVTLQLPAIDYELDRKNYDGALERLDLLAAPSPRKESWLKRRGEILLQAGRPEEARAAFQQALEALRSLPPARRHVPAMVDLERKLLSHLETEPVPVTQQPKS